MNELQKISDFDKLVTNKITVLTSGKKLRDYEPSVRLNYSLQTFEMLLKRIGVSNKSDVEHHKEALRFLNSNFLDLSYEEILLAFDLAMSGEIKIDLFQQINALVIGKVLAEYRVYKAKKIIELRKKQEIMDEKNQLSELTESGKRQIVVDGCLRVFNEYKNTLRILGTCDHVYDYLFKLGLLPTDKLYKELIFGKAQVVAIYETKQDLGLTEREIINKIQRIKAGGEKELCISISKRLVLSEYFGKLIKSGSDLKTVLDVTLWE